MSKKRIISGVQPTGNLHLGNYLGAIKNWVKIQNDYESLFFLADLHAITVEQEPEKLKNSLYQVTAAYIASGIDENISTIFAQSDVKEHAELAWILNCFTPVGWLKRMTQFKDKAGKNQDNASSGLFTYPVLMSADILLYSPDFVPAGEDQKQHIEFTRDLGELFNRRYNENIFKIPDILIPEVNKRVKSLRDGKKKMSKSDESDLSRINLSDSKDDIISKIKKAKTDSIPFISYDPENRPEIANLLEIYSSFTDMKIQNIIDEYPGENFSKFKMDLAEILAEKLYPINSKYNYLLNNKDHIINILKNGKTKASEIASKMILKIKDKMGFLNN